MKPSVLLANGLIECARATKPFGKAGLNDTSRRSSFRAISVAVFKIFCPKMSYQHIASVFGLKNHTTVLKNCRNYTIEDPATERWIIDIANMARANGLMEYVRKLNSNKFLNQFGGKND